MCGVQAPALVGKMEDLQKELSMLISNPSSNCEARITKFSNYLFAKFRKRMDLIMKLGFDPVLDDVILLFRSCILVLTHPQFNGSVLLDKCNALISVLAQISSFEAKASNSQPSFILALLEVFIKESLANPDLRRYLHLAQGNLNITHELFSTHFILSYPKSQNFIESLSFNTFNDGKETQNELGLNMVLELLNPKSSFQIPFLLRAHMTVIGSGYFENRDPVYCPLSDEILLDRAINAFESSINLYFRCLCGLDNPIGSKPKLGQKLDCYMDDMILYCRTQSDEILRSDFLRSLFSYVEEAQCVVHEHFRQQAGFTLKRILFGLLSRNNELKNKIGAERKITEEMVCLAASLKLMGSSLLQVLDRFREVKNEKGYERISDIVRRFTDYEANQIERKVSVVDVVGNGLVRGEKSFGMLCHLINMLMYGLDEKIGFLWKGCVVMIMAVMDLIIFEQGSLDSVKLLIADVNKGTNNADLNTQERNLEEEESSDSSESLQMRTSPRGSIYRKSSIGIAREIQKVKKRLFVSHDTRKDHSGGKSKRDGLAFFKCLAEYKRNPWKWDDLVDFIDCEADKDYSVWLNNRESCRKLMHGLKYEPRNRIAKKVGFVKSGGFV
ncbi:hypothetical protein LUZ60_015225 [Juncus effusus]|nr:hypothetical protein LUZ60_015225 [Juncus effusus]